MELPKIMETLHHDYFHKLAEMQDSASYAYVQRMMDEIKMRGLDPFDYEVVIVSENRMLEDDAKVVFRLRLMSKEELTDNRPDHG